MEHAPTPDDAPRAAASCPACRAPTLDDQRYCLACGALVGDRRLDPIEMLAPAMADGPAGDPPRAAAAVLARSLPPAGSGASPRAVPLAAATAAIVVAGISGMLVTNGGSGNGARAAVVAAAAPAAAAPRPAPAPASNPADDAEPLPADDPPADDPLPADPLPVESEAPAEPITDDAPADDDASEDEEAADEPAAEATPRVWLLALEGPQAADAVERIATQGVRLSGMAGVATAAHANASALVSGTRPAAAAPAAAVAPAAAGVSATPANAGTPASAGATPEAAPSLPAALTAAKRTWRAYVDVQPTGGPVLPGACAAPTVGDPAAGLLAARLPFAGIESIGCDKAVTSLEALGNDLSSGEDVPAFSYVAMGGCAPPERTAVALPDAVEDTVATITASTEFQQDGMLVVTTVGTQDACTPAAPAPVPADPAAPTAPADGGPAAPDGAAGASPTNVAAPTAVLRPAATAGKTVVTKLDLLALSRAMAAVLGVTPPGAAGDDAVPAIKLPGVPKQ